MYVSLLVIILIIPLLLVAKNFNKEKITLNVAPSSANIQVDGKSSKAKTFKLSKTEHIFVISLSNFKTVTKKVNLAKEGSQDFELALTPANEMGKQYLKDNPDYQLERERIGSGEFQKTSQSLAKKYPFLAELPYYNRDFKISYGEPVKTRGTQQNPAIALYVKGLRPQDRKEAVSKLYTDLGIEPNSVEIIFDDYISPFGYGSKANE